MFSNSKKSTALVLPSFLGLASIRTTAASPTPQQQIPFQLEDIQCRCLSFSTSATPTPCSYQELLSLDWDTAYSLATTNDFKIQFASEATRKRLLAIPKPLPLSILHSIHEGEALPLDPAGKVQNENRIICGFGNEVDRVGRDGSGKGLVDEVHYVGTVLGYFMLFLIVYVVGEWVWTR
jgi:hypothetical protein